jgi:hypothetical protein
MAKNHHQNFEKQQKQKWYTLLCLNVQNFCYFLKNQVNMVKNIYLYVLLWIFFVSGVFSKFLCWFLAFTKGGKSASIYLIVIHQWTKKIPLFPHKKGRVKCPCFVKVKSNAGCITDNFSIYPIKICK